MDAKHGQRLFRLTSQSNDGVFDTTFNEDIIIQPGSEIALQSTAFDRESSFVDIDGTNDTIEYGLATTTGGITDWQTKIPQGRYYTLTQGEALMGTITDQLNRVISVNDTANNKNISGGNYFYSPNLGSQWKFALDNDGGSALQAKTATACFISDSSYASSDAFNTVASLKGGAQAPVVTAAGTAGAMDYISRPAGGTGGATDYNSSYVFGKIRVCKGAASIRMRLRGGTATGAAATATMGLVTDKSVLENGTIADADIHWGIQVQGFDAVYRQKTSAAGAWSNADDGTGNPLLVANATPPADDGAGLLNTNDVIEIQINGDEGQEDASGPTVAMLVHQGDGTGGGDTEYDLVSATDGQPSQSTDYYWFVSFHKPTGEADFDMLEAYMDPYLFTQETQATKQQSELTTVVRQAMYGDLIPQLGRSIWGLDDRELNFVFETQEVAAFWGFDNPDLGRLQGAIPQSLAESQDYEVNSPKRVEFSVTAKNYILLFDTLPIDSYDSYARFDATQRAANSGGSRRNILATIPTAEEQVANSTITRIAYEPSTPNYIMLKNKGPYITRSLQCRLLTATYQPVVVDGMANLTVLIREGHGSC